MNKILLNGLHYTHNGAGISKYNEMMLKTFINENYNVDILLRNEFKRNSLFNNKYNIIFADKDIKGSKDRILYEQLYSKGFYKNYDVIHFPDYATPTLYNGNKIATIHDMAMYTMRDKYTFMQNLTKNIFLKNTIKNAEKLICVSNFAKNELLKYYPSLENKIKVIYEGIQVDNIKINEQESYTILNKYNINSKKYILYVGTIAPHKNIKTLIEAFNYINNKIPEYKLVVCGKKGWMYDEVFKTVNELNLTDKIVFTDFVNNNELEVLYRNAELFVSVSLYEGFGFPPLEAMARNLAVLVSDIPVFKETCLDCAEYCNPNEIEDIGSKILKLVNNEKIRENNIKKADIRAGYFNWSRAAEETYKVYEELL